jgi:hypothetical protein
MISKYQMCFNGNKTSQIRGLPEILKIKSSIGTPKKQLETQHHSRSSEKNMTNMETAR